MLTLTTHARAGRRTGEDSHAMVQTLVAIGLLCMTTLALLAAPVPTGKPGNYPAWWFSRNVIAQKNPTNASPAWPANYPTSDDYAGINQGQLKNLATAAYNELRAQAPTNVWTTPQGTNLTALVTGWNPASGDAYAGVNLGQLKTVAKPFYDLLMQIGYTGAYPWTGVNADDYAAANIGQAKYAFSFDVTAAPLAVTGLTVTAAVNELDLAWTDPPYNPMENLTVLQSTDGGSTWTAIATLSPGATSFAATNLDPNLSYSYKISSNRNTSGGSAATGSTAPAPPISLPRYALIDLGTNMTPVAMNNSNVVVGNSYNGSSYTSLIWSNGTNTTLPVGSFTSAGASGIDDSGHMVGGGLVAGTGNSEVIYWANSASTPVGLGFSATAYGETYGTSSYYYSIGGDGSIIGTIRDNGSNYGAIAATFTPGGSPSYLWVPDPTGVSYTWVLTTSKARGHWAADYYNSGSGSTGAVVDGTEYPNVYAPIVNDSGVTVGTDYVNALIIAGTGSGTTLGPGEATALNNATVTSGTNTVAQPQIVGYDASGNPILWDHTNPDGTTSSTYVGKKINSFCPTHSGWTVTYAAAINNSGSICGNANYSGTNSAIPQGQHGCLLVPCQFRLLNGAQSGTDGMDFSGNRPTTISATSSYATSTLVNNCISVNAGLDKIGVDLPFGSGRPTAPGITYVCSIMMLARVSPPAATNITYAWDRAYEDQSLTISKTSTNTWYVNEAPGSSTTPVEDTRSSTDTNIFYTVTPSTNNNVVAFYDNPGMEVAFFTNGAPHTNDYAYEKTDFTYSLTNSIGAASTSPTPTQHVGQIIIAKRTGTSGVITNDWTGITNYMNTTTIPICTNVTTAEIRAVVGGTNTIIFDSSVPH